MTEVIGIGRPGRPAGQSVSYFRSFTLSVMTIVDLLNLVVFLQFKKKS